VWAKHFDTTGNESFSATTVSVVIDAAALIIIGASQFVGKVGGGNLLTNSSFEADSNSDGVADAWSITSGGATGLITNSVVSNGAVHGLYAQQINAAALGTSSNDYAGVGQTVIGAAKLIGLTVRMSAYMIGALNVATGRISIQAFNGATFLSFGAADVSLAGGARKRIDATFVVPGSTTELRVYSLAVGAVSAGAASLFVDAAQLEVGDLMTAYAPREDEILPGVVGTTELAAEAATTVTNINATAISVTAQSSVTNPYLNSRWTEIQTHTFTPNYTGICLVLASGEFSLNTQDATTDGTNWYAVLTTALHSGVRDAAGRAYQVEFLLGRNLPYKGSFVHAREFAVVSGVATTIYFDAQRTNPNVPTTIDRTNLRVEQIRR
jgi:hypothetical protein